MNENEMLYCLIAFILGYLVSRHIGNGFNVSGQAIPLCNTYNGSKSGCDSMGMKCKWNNNQCENIPKYVCLESTGVEIGSCKAAWRPGGGDKQKKSKMFWTEAEMLSCQQGQRPGFECCDNRKPKPGVVGGCVRVDVNDPTSEHYDKAMDLINSYRV